MIEPIKPSDVDIEIPDLVIEIVNEFIKKEWDGEQSRILQTDIVNEIIARYPGMEDITSETVFKNHWLDFEDVYRQVGWKVEYDKPGFNEFYEPFFIFEKQ